MMIVPRDGKLCGQLGVREWSWGGGRGGQDHHYDDGGHNDDEDDLDHDKELDGDYDYCDNYKNMIMIWYWGRGHQWDEDSHHHKDDHYDDLEYDDDDNDDND